MIYDPSARTPHYPIALRFPPVPLRPDTAALLAISPSTPRLTKPPMGLPMPRLMPSEPIPGLAVVEADAAESREEKEPEFERRIDDAMREVWGVRSGEGDPVGGCFAGAIDWSV